FGSLRQAGPGLPMGGKQSTAARSRGPFPGVSTDDSAVPPPGGPPHFGHYRAGGGAMGMRSRSVSSVAGMGMDPSAAGGVPFGLYAAAARAAGDPERAPGSGGGGSGADSTYAHGNGYQETGGGRHGDGMLYLGPRASLADALPLHIAPRWFSAHSGESRRRGARPGWARGSGFVGGPAPRSPTTLGTGSRKGGAAVDSLACVRKRGTRWSSRGPRGSRLQPCSFIGRDWAPGALPKVDDQCLGPVATGWLHMSHT
ncbi:zinc and ring finger 1, partial [Chelydra serpentina]